VSKAEAQPFEALANRLRKNARHWDKWARREGIEAFRIYDRDIPEFPYAIDRYADWLHVQLFEPRRPIVPAELDGHLAAIAGGARVPPHRLVLKVRQRQRGSAQYQKTEQNGPSFTLRERDLRFEVNLHRYLDTGLFPDHRDTRRLVRERAAGRSVLNLFAYTGSFTVYAAAGGAARTLSVDMSNTYQDWTRRNLRLNGFDDPERHRLHCQDALQFLIEAGDTGERFDLIVLDPPSFSNSKRMRASLDVQRDHPELLRRTLTLLAPDGELVFSTNRRGFRLDPAIAAEFACEDISARSLPPDFRRRPPHRCWRIRRP
jgi:23S rRNA (cytosine1962-C5)-methyltransferase